MSFRQFGGLNYAARHNIVSSNYNTSNNLIVSQNIGQPNSYINFLSDISGNISIYGNFDLSGNLNVSENINVGGNIDISGNVDVGGNIDISGNVYADEFYITGPLINAPNSVVPKAYVDAISGGLEPKSSCECATISAISPGTYVAPNQFTGVGTTLIIDGYSLQNNDRVLVKNEGSYNSSLNAYTGVENGIYVYSSSGGGTLTRSTDMAAGSSISQAVVPVKFGTQNSTSSWFQSLGTSQSPLIVGTDQLEFVFYVRLQLSLGQGLNYTESNGETYINVDTSLNFVNFLDNKVGPNAGTLNIGTNTTNNIIIGPTGTSVPIKTQSIIQAQRGITGATGSFQNLTCQEGDIKVGQLTSGGINIGGFGALSMTGGPVQIANTTMTLQDSNINQTGVSNKINTFYSSNFPSGLTGATGSFNNLYVTNKAQFLQDISVNTINIGLGGGQDESNLVIGAESLDVNTMGRNNIAIGQYSLASNTTGSSNTSVGFASLNQNILGSNNTGFGVSSLRSNTSGTNNTAVGAASLYTNSTGQFNTAIGVNSLFYNISGTNNTSLGYYAGYNNTTFSNSTAIGANSQITGSNQIMLGGFNSGVYPQVVVPGGITGPTGSFSYLNSSNNTYLATTNGKVGIGTTTPATLLDVSGDLNIDGLSKLSSLNVTGTSTFNNSLPTSTQTPSLGSELTTKTYVDSSISTSTTNLLAGNNTWTGSNTFNNNLNVNQTTTITANTSWANITSNPLPGELFLKTTTGSTRLILGTYYTSGVGSAGAIQSSDFYSGLDHANPLILNPLGGNIGIGTIAPAYTLDVNGNTNILSTLNVGPIGLATNAQLKIYETTGTGPYTQSTPGATPTDTGNSNGSLVISHNNSGGSSSIVFPSNVNNGAGDYAYIQYFDNVNAGYPGSLNETGLLLIGIENDAFATGGPDRISLYSCGGYGYVGINTLYPNSPLDVNGTIKSNSQFQLYDQVQQVNLAINATTSFNCIQSGFATGNPKPLLIQDFNNNSTVYVDVLNKRVGIGSGTAPSYPLDVSGNVGVSGTLYSSKEVICPYIATNLNPANGYTSLQSGNGTKTGYIEFRQNSSVRLGYIGYANTTTTPPGPIFFTAENGCNGFEFNANTNANANITTSGTLFNMSRPAAVTDVNSVIGQINFTNTNFNGTPITASIQSCVNVGGNYNNTDLRFFTSLDFNNLNVERMRIDRSGNVGIGTTTPAYNLDVTGGIRATSTLDLKTVTGDAANSWISIRPQANYNYIESGYSDGVKKSLLFSGINADNPTMCIDPANIRVGINNTLPNYPLDVTGNGRFVSDDPQLILTNNMQAYNGGKSSILFQSQTSNNPMGKIETLDVASAPGAYQNDMIFYTGFNTQNYERMRILGNSDLFTYVGIGTPSPAYTLDVSGNIRAYSTISSSNSGQGSASLGTGYLINTTYYTGISYFTTYNGTRVGYIGNVSYLDSPLDVNGPMQFRAESGCTGFQFICDENSSANITTTGTLNVGGLVTAPQFKTTSDYRIKENIENLDDGYSVDNLRPVSYYNKETKQKDIGVIAHELQEYYPFLVNGVKDGKEYQSVNYDGLIPILIKEIQELKKEMKIMKDKYKDL